MAVETRPKLTGLSSLRYLAAVHVLLFHAFAMKLLGWAPRWFQKIGEIGFTAVSFFLVLSGFVLVYGYAGTPLQKWSFWRARLVRIYPAYLFSLIFTSLFFFYAVVKLNIPELAWYKAHIWTTVALCLTMLQGWVPQAALGWNAVGWALSTFMFCYLIFPAVLKWAERTPTKSIWAVAGLAWATSLGLAIGYSVIKPDHVAYANPYHLNLVWLNFIKFNPLIRSSEFMVGVALGFQVIRNPQQSRSGGQLVLAALAVFVCLVLVYPWVPYQVMHSGLAVPAFVLLIWGMARRPKAAVFLENRAFALLGDASLSFYLLHSNVLGIIVFAGNSTPHATPGRLAFAVLVATVVSLMAYLLIEMPVLKWLDPRKRKPKLQQAIAVAS